MSQSSKEKIFIGSFIHSNECGELIVIDRGMIHVKNGKVFISQYLFIFNLLKIHNETIYVSHNIFNIIPDINVLFVKLYIYLCLDLQYNNKPEFK